MQQTPNKQYQQLMQGWQQPPGQYPQMPIQPPAPKKKSKLPLIVVVLLALIIVGISSLPIKASAISSGQDTESSWKESVFACNLNLCGDYPQNVATLSLKEGVVTIDKKGGVHVELSQLRFLATQKLAANKTLQVFFGSFTYLANNARLLGTIRTDSRGNFEGSIDTGNGLPFAFSPGIPVSGQFIFNDEPIVRSEFITGFSPG